MRPQLLSGLRHMRRSPGRVLQVIFAVALGVALFVSSYVSITGIEESIHRSARSMSGKAEWVVTGAGAGSVPENLLERLRKTDGAVAAPFLSASVTLLGPRPEKLQVWGIDTQTDSMLRLYGTKQMPDLATSARMAFVRNSVLVSEGFARAHRLSSGSTLRVATRTGPTSLNVAGTVPDSALSRGLGGALAFMDVHGAEALFGQPGMLDSIQVSGISEPRLKELAEGFNVRSVDTLTAAARDAVTRVQSLYSLSLVAMLIGCFVVFSSVQVSVLERLKQLATFRALGASRLQLLTSLLIEWLILGLIGSVAGVLVGVSLSSVTLRALTGDVNSMVPLVRDARPEVSWVGFALGIGIGLVTVLAAALLPALGAVRESPLLALRPHTYRLRHRQMAAFWAGLVVLVVGLWLSQSGSFVQTLAAIVLSFFGLALLMPQATLMGAAATRGLVARAFGFAGFFAADNLRKAPQRTAFNVIALGGALAMMVSTASLIDGFSVSTHAWIRASLPFDLSVTATDLAAGVYSEETLPRSLVSKLRKVDGVTFAYGVRQVFTPYQDHDVMIVSIPTTDYLEAHRRKGTLDWARLMAKPENVEALRSGLGLFASDNFLALTGRSVGDDVELQTPSGRRRFRILGPIEDYSWPRGLVAMDIGVLASLWKSQGLTYIDLQVTDSSNVSAVKGRIAELTRNDFSVEIRDKKDILAISDDVLHQLTSAAEVQVWLAAIIGFLGIGNSLMIGVLQRQREIGLVRAVGMSRSQLQATVAIEALLIGVGAGVLGMAGGLLGGWLPLRHFTFVVSGYLYPMVVPWAVMGRVFVSAILIAVVAAVIPVRRIAQVPVLTSIAVE